MSFFGEGLIGSAMACVRSMPHGEKTGKLRKGQSRPEQEPNLSLSHSLTLITSTMDFLLDFQGFKVDLDVFSENLSSSGEVENVIRLLTIPASTSIWMIF